MNSYLLWIGLACAAITPVLSADPPDSFKAFEQIKALTGNWNGTYEWTGGRKANGSMSATYYVTGNGSAVVENLITDGAPSMTSVYHLDGSNLRMTHFCAAQNQPRLKASRIDLAQGAIDFDFVDATNLRSAEAPHVHGLEIRLLDPNHVTLTFLFHSGSVESREKISLQRTEAKLSQGALYHHDP
jgi:hypothetical protein